MGSVSAEYVYPQPDYLIPSARIRLGASSPLTQQTLLRIFKSVTLLPRPMVSHPPCFHPTSANGFTVHSASPQTIVSPGQIHAPKQHHSPGFSVSISIKRTSHDHHQRGNGLSTSTTEHGNLPRSHGCKKNNFAQSLSRHASTTAAVPRKRRSAIRGRI